MWQTGPLLEFLSAGRLSTSFATLDSGSRPRLGFGQRRQRRNRLRPPFEGGQTFQERCRGSGAFARGLHLPLLCQSLGTGMLCPLLKRQRSLPPGKRLSPQLNSRFRVRGAWPDLAPRVGISAPSSLRAKAPAKAPRSRHCHLELSLIARGFLARGLGILSRAAICYASSCSTLPR